MSVQAGTLILTHASYRLCHCARGKAIIVPEYQDIAHSSRGQRPRMMTDHVFTQTYCILSSPGGSKVPQMDDPSG